jgi:drug/metabolite transporter (DMT)-like permease
MRIAVQARRAVRATRVRGALLAGAGVLVISPDALIVRAVDADAWTAIAWRGVFTAVGALALVAVPGSIADAPRASGGRYALAGGLFAAASVAFVTALYRTDAATVLAIVAAGPLIAAVLARFAGEVPAPRTWAAAGAVVVGLAVIVATDGVRGRLDGSLLALAGAACFAGFLTVARTARPADMTLAFAVGGALAAAAGFVAGADPTVGVRDLILLGLLGLLILPASLFLIARATRHLPAPEVGLILLLETLLGPLWVWAALGELPDAPVVAGGIVIVAAVAAHALAARRAAGPEPAQG